MAGRTGTNPDPRLALVDRPVIEAALAVGRVRASTLPRPFAANRSVVIQPDHERA